MYLLSSFLFFYCSIADNTVQDKNEHMLRYGHRSFAIHCFIFVLSLSLSHFISAIFIDHHLLLFYYFTHTQTNSDSSEHEKILSFVTYISTSSHFALVFRCINEWCRLSYNKTFQTFVSTVLHKYTA